jgi:uncharacterized protein YceK
MTRRSLLLLFLAAAFPLLSGCGTVLNLARPGGNPFYEFQSQPKMYGGVCEDVRWAWTLVSDSPGGSYPIAGKVAQLVVAPCVLCIDLPLSAVADTLTLPLTVRSALHENNLHPASALEQQMVTLSWFSLIWKVAPVELASKG